MENKNQKKGHVSPSTFSLPLLFKLLQIIILIINRNEVQDIGHFKNKQAVLTLKNIYTQP